MCEMEHKMETMRAQLQDELASVRAVLEHERNKLHQSQDDGSNLNNTYDSCPILLVVQIIQIV